MANRTFNQFQGTLEKGVVQLYVAVKSNGTSQPTVLRAKGIGSVIKLTNSQWQIEFQDKYLALLGMDYIVETGGAGPGTDNVCVTGNYVQGTQDANGALWVTFFNNGSAVTPTADTIYYFTISLSNSSAL